MSKVLTLLRIGHTPMAHHFLLGGRIPPVCDQCHVQFIDEQDFIKFTTTRLHYDVNNKNIKVVLEDDADIGNVRFFK